MNEQTSYRKKGRAVFLAAIMLLSMVAMSAAFAGSAAAAVDSADRSIDSTEATAGSTVTVTVTASYDSETSDARVNDIIDPALDADNIEIVDDDGATISSYQASSGTITGSWGSVTSVTLVYEVTVPEDASVGTVYDFSAGEVEDGDDSDVVSISGDETIEVVEDTGSDDGTTADDLPGAPEGADAFFGDYNGLTSSSVWQGQTVEVDLTSSSVTGTAEVNLYERISDSNTQLRQELTTESGVVEFETEDLSEGDYFLTGAGDLPTRSEAQDNIDVTFGVNEQSLVAEFDADSVTDEGVDSDTDFEFDSNRRTYPITIHAEGDLDPDELLDIFVNNGPFTAAYTEEGDDGETDYDEIGISGVSDSDEYNVDFVDIEPGEYDFTFTGTDSTAEATDSITVVEEDKDADFSEGVYQSAAGDVVEFEIELEDTSDTYIQIGDQTSDFLDVVYVEADDDDEPVSFQVNTRTLGSSPDRDEVYNPGDNVDAFESAIDQDFNGEDDFNSGVFYSENLDRELSFAEYVQELGIVEDGEDGTHQLTRPMQPTDYELYAGVEGDDAVFIADEDDRTEADNELDNAVLELTANGPEEITTWVAPSDDADEDDTKEDLLEAVTERSDIAIEDRLVVQYEASGIYGAMVSASDDGFDILDDGTTGDIVYDLEQLEGGIDFTFESEDVIGNQDPTALAFDRLDDESEGFVIIDNDEGEFYLVVDTSDDSLFSDGEPEDGADYDIELEYGTDDDERAKFGGGSEAGEPYNTGGIDGFPYFAADSTQSISSEITFEDAEVSFDNLNADDEIQAENIEDSEISGATNVAPGSSAELRVRSTDASTSFRQSTEVDIESDGSISAEFDFDDQEVGDEFDTRFRVTATNIDTVDSVIVEEGSLGVADPVEDDDEEPADDDEEPVDDDEDVVDDDDDEEEPTDDETPGFGALVALVALIGAALLAARRQN